MNRLLEEMIAKYWMSKCDQNKTAQFLKDQRIEHPHLQRQQIFSEKPWLLLAHRVKVNWRGIQWKRSTIQHLKKKTKLEIVETQLKIAHSKNKMCLEAMNEALLSSAEKEKVRLSYVSRVLRETSDE